MTTSVEMARYPYESLKRFVEELLITLKTPYFIAKCVAEVIVNADLVGHNTHGLNSLPSYLKEIQNGIIQPFSEPHIIRSSKSKVFLDGGKGFGHFAALKATDIAVNVAKENGTASVWLKNSNNIGRLGEYAERIAAKNSIGFIMNGSGLVDSDAVTSIPGDVQRVLGTNPIAVGIPTNIVGKPFLIDLSTAITSYYNIELHRKLGKEIPTGWVIDKEGYETNSPEDFYNDGALALFGGYKGFALSLMICTLCGFSDISKMGKEMQGTFIFVINLEDDEYGNIYKHNVERFLQYFREKHSACRLPYDRSYFMKKQNLEKGIDVPLALVKSLDFIASELNSTCRLMK